MPALNAPALWNFAPVRHAVALTRTHRRAPKARSDANRKKLMRSSKSRSRNKSRGQRTLGNVVNRVFDSSGPEGKVRGTPQQLSLIHI